MNRHAAVMVGLSLAVAICVPARTALAAPKPFSGLVPRSSVVYLEITRPGQVLDFVLDGPLWQQFWSYDFVQAAFERDHRMTQLRQVIGAFEAKLGMKWRPMLEQLVAGGLGVAVDPDTQGVVILIRSGDKALPDRLLDTFVDLARQDALGKGRGDPIRVSQYRGISAYRAGAVHFASLDQGLIITNQGELGKKVIDNHLDRTPATLADDEAFKRATADRSGKRAAWSFVRLGRLRQLGVGPKASGARSDNPGAELIFGGVLSAFEQAQHATAELLLTPTDARLSLAVPFDSDAIPKTRGFFFAPAGGDGAAKPLKPAGTIVAGSFYRDLGRLWSATPDLLDEQAAAKIAQADSALSQFFGGRSFGSEVLGSIQPQLRWVVARQDFKAVDGPTPAIKIPAFAIVFRSSKAGELWPFLKVAFQNGVGLAGIAGTQQGMPPLDLNTQKQGKGQLVSASYLPAPDAGEAGQGRIQYNFSPCLGTTGNTFVLSSTQQLAAQLIDLAGDERSDLSIEANTLVELDAPSALAALRENTHHLIAQNMLEKGHGKEAATAEIETLMSLLDTIEGAWLSLVAQKGSLQLNLGLTLQGE